MRKNSRMKSKLMSTSSNLGVWPVVTQWTASAIFCSIGLSVAISSDLWQDSLDLNFVIAVPTYKYICMYVASSICRSVLSPLPLIPYMTFALIFVLVLRVLWDLSGHSCDFLSWMFELLNLSEYPGMHTIDLYILCY